MSVKTSCFDNKEESVFELLTELCHKTVLKCSSQNNLQISQKQLVSKMRSQIYDIMLKKSCHDVWKSEAGPVADLLSYYFKLQNNVKNYAEHKRCQDLKKIIGLLKTTEFDDKDTVFKVIQMLVAISDSTKENLGEEMFRSPFSFGLLDEMLPKPPRPLYGSAQPYAYYPPHVFELPYSLKHEENCKTPSDYTVEFVDSKLLLPDKTTSQDIREVKTFVSPMSLPSLSVSRTSPYSESGPINFSGLTAPRDLKIPSNESVLCPKVSFAKTENDVKEVFRANREDSEDIWDIAKKVNNNVSVEIWEVVAKLPLVNERQLIASSKREVNLWRNMYSNELGNLNIISEKQFIRHIMYLNIGIETKSFQLNKEQNCFMMKENLVLEGISKGCLKNYVSDLLLVGTFYKRLYGFAFNQILEDQFHGKGLVYEAAREVIRRYLLDFRLKATEIYEECIRNTESNCMPTLLQILFHMEPLKYEIESISCIYRVVDIDTKSCLPSGAELMSYLFSEISLITHKETANTMFNALFTICQVYFKFIERFVFEGELDDRFYEFFIRKDSHYVNSKTKKYWDKGFYITQSVSVPEFLIPLAKCILLCGKSLRLLKLCNPNDPLVLLISSDHPSVKCCANFKQLEQQQQILDVYRTRCMFVSEPVTFEQIVLKREAERKAFTEIAALKQAETLEKIIAERKRLAQLIIAEKQHSLKVLEAAMAETKAAKNRKKQKDKKLTDLEKAAQKSVEEVDSKTRDYERTKIMEYYSKLNLQVEKSKIHTEWKIKRLQLDQSRMQLLSSEERNLKREKLELEHQKSEEIMAMSIRSDDDPNLETDEDIIVENLAETEFEANREKAQSSNDVFSVICKVAKSLFGGLKTEEVDNDIKCDNYRKKDVEGNIVPSEIEKSKTSNDIIGGNLDNLNDNLEFLRNRRDAVANRLKVMAHEYGQTDKENNTVKEKQTVDFENNIELSANQEAQRNKIKVLGTEFGLAPENKVTVVEPITEAQKEAIVNKHKVLGVEYNLPPEIKVKKEPANLAQEEAVRNRLKAEGVDYNLNKDSYKVKRSDLTLDLKSCGNMGDGNFGVTPNTGLVTPAEFSRLDLETPTTSEIPIENHLDILSPIESDRVIEPEAKNEKKFLNSNGFDFSLIVDDENENISDPYIANSFDDSPIKKHKPFTKPAINLIDGTYNLDNFDPFGMKELKMISSNLTNKMSIDIKDSFYTDPNVIIKEVTKKPYRNIFLSRFESESEVLTVDSNNIATITACLQRSVMLPLTYQLEVVNNSILTYFLINLDMYEHLKSLKDYFFLMDGEFSRSICHNLFKKLVTTVNPQELLNFATLHNILDKALGSSISHVSKFSENLSFLISDLPLSFQHSSPDVLQCLSLTYSVEWPLNIILSQEALVRYMKVFHFLIKMRRIGWILGDDFECLKLSVKLSKSNSRKLLRSPQYISIQLYRHIMASLIRSLDSYIVNTCILTSWTEFEGDLKKARTLDDLYECHVVYIKKVLFRCLLNNRSTPVMKILNDIFTVILKFSRVLKPGEWRQNDARGHFTHPRYNQLDELFHLFEKLTKYLHKVITRLMECGYQRHLVELLTLINLNGYYDPEKSKSDTVQSP